MKKGTLAALLAAILLPAALVAQDPSARIDAAMQRAGQAGIPVSLLQERVAEGRAKGVPLDRIAVAVERRGEALTAAQAAMGPATPALTQADLAAGADAVEAGIPAGALRQLVQGMRAEDRPVAIAVLTFLHTEQGLPVEQALAQVSDALARGPEALQNLPAQAAGRRGPPADRPGPPTGVGRPDQPGPPGAVPGPGQRPGAGRPDGTGGGPPQGGGGPPSGRGPGG